MNRAAVLDRTENNRPLNALECGLATGRRSNFEFSVGDPQKELPINETLYWVLTQRCKQLYRIGDCVAPRYLPQAVMEGARSEKEPPLVSEVMQRDFKQGAFPGRLFSEQSLAWIEKLTPGFDSLLSIAPCR